MSFVSSWLWPAEKKPERADVAAHSNAVRSHFNNILDHTDPPKTFTPRAVALELTESELAGLGYTSWEDAIPAIYELIWELRALGDLVIIYRGKVLPDDVHFTALEAPIKIMRAEQ